MVVMIGGAEYEATRNPSAESIRLSKPGGAVYDVEMSAGRAVCNCPDFTYRHAPLPYSNGCKHVQAVTKGGLL